MHLKRLEIKGFKSFAYRVDFQFDKGVTGVVGPNGCGKSNVTEAVRWVLGEQSARNLRGYKMEDVIFSGTDRKRPQSMAEVSIVLDNASQGLRIPYEEVCLTRRVYRSGEGEYLINGSPCRRKDVKELLMDTGIGKEGYSMISQGRIDEILSQKGEDRRLLFDEAAGIVKYRTRKEEAEKKIERTEDNLLRIKDILLELDQHLSPLSQQASKAETYLELKEKIDYLEVSEVFNSINNQKQAIEENQNRLYGVRKEMDQLVGQEESLQHALRKKEDKLECLRTVMIESRNLLETKKSELDENRLQQQMQMQQIQHQQQQIKTLEKTLEEQAKIFQTVETKLDDLKKKSLYASEVQKNKEEAFRKSQELITRQKKMVAKIRNQVEENKTDVVEALKKLNSYQNQFERIHTLKETAHHRWSDLLKEIKEKSDSLKSNKHLYRKNQDEKKRVAEQKKQLEIRISSEKEKYSRKQEEFNLMQNELMMLKQELQRITQQKNLLVNLEKNFEGFQRGVKNVLKAVEEKTELSDGFHGVVADLLDVPQGYEIAVETALGQSIQFLVTEYDHQARKIIEFLRKTNQGRVTILPIKTIQVRSFKQNEYSVLSGFTEATCALDLVHFPEPYKSVFSNLLGRVVIAEDLEIAMKISRKFKQQIKIATLKGELIMPGGSMTGGSHSKQQDGLLLRKREIDELSHEVCRIQKKLENESGKMESIQKQVFQCKSLLEDLHKQLDELEKQDIRIASFVDNLCINVKELEGASQRLNSEKKDLEKNLSYLGSEEEKILLHREEIEKRIEAERGAVDKEIQVLKVEEENLETMLDKNTSLRVEMAEFREKNVSFQNEKKELVARKEQEYLKKEQIQVQIIQIKKDLQGVSNELDRLTKEQKQLESKQQYQKEILDKLQQEEEDYRHLRINQLGELETLRKRVESIRAHYTQIQMKISKKEWEVQQLLEKLALYNIDSLDEAEQRMQRPPLPSMNSYSLKGLKEEMQSLGEVHVGAIEEYRRVKERHTFLTTQKQDMEDARDSLQDIIKELEEKMVQQFELQFKKIQVSFKKVFQQLFNGGNAELVLDNPDCILQSGVDVVAQPPGKKFQHLSLLSGGEKAMTAISLLFGILLVKPSPFCVLDEIEAALDDANVGRFADFLVDLSKEIQFVVVTHKKLTMERVDTLYGITMEEKGISKLLRLKLADLDEKMIAG